MYSVSTAAILHTQKNNQKVDNCDKLNNRGGKFEAIKHIPTSNKLQQTTFSNWLSEWPHIGPEGIDCRQKTTADLV